ncbi:glycosyltransferase [Allokutzneria oryzae]|uniref:Glycosyltransferase n=1 Tax=Allokutzneria oryzae TaxID=1378989 RepID=A0ABV6A0A2_9PSEU
MTLRAVGADPSPDVLALHGGLNEVVGRVPDARPWLSVTRLHVVPMRFGARVKSKSVDSMSADPPFVTTPVGAEGLHLGTIARFLVGESPAEMVSLCDRLLRDDALWVDVQQEMLRICREHFSAEGFRRSMEKVLVDCGVA